MHLWRNSNSFFAVAIASFFSTTAVQPAAAQIVSVNQGSDWTQESRESFYTQDQGSRIMPVAWMRSLKLPDGQGFLHDSLTRYGYLENPGAPEPDVPVGFTIVDEDGTPSIGMTCSACHTRQIDVGGTAYRIDGGPGIVDFQNFLKDLDDAVLATLGDAETFDVFADAVLGSGSTQQQKSELKLELEIWSERFHTLIDRSLPSPEWGPSRLDAVSMIFNRLAGLDLGKAPTYLIPENIQVADAPTRYPFLWNAARQDMTQWPGFAANGNAILGLARNLGEVYGVFADFRPVKQTGIFRLNRDYLAHNSANFSGLTDLEDLIWKIGPPKWPWQYDQALAAKGKEIFNWSTDLGGCVECHGIKPGKFRSPFHGTWATPILDVGTDRRECEILGRTVQTGVMDGAKVPFSDKIEETDTAFNVLATTVIGAIIQNGLSHLTEQEATSMLALEAGEPQLPPEFNDLNKAFQGNARTLGLALEAAAQSCAYESRVLEGIWAAAPYLHNGSVPNLEELLKPASERVASFKIGPNYDIQKVGLAIEQTKFNYTLNTTDCSDLSSGNSRCGHEYGTSLSDQEKAALLEYLKTL